MRIDITKDLVAHVAKLGMLKVDENEMEAYLSHFEKALKSIEDLDGVDTNGLLPFTNPMRERLDFFKDHIESRDDSILPSQSFQDILKNSPDQKLNQFRIEGVINKLGIVQVSDPIALEDMAQKIVSANPTQVEQYLSGKDRVFGFFVGLMMKESNGQANPKTANDIIKKILDSKKGII